MQACEAPIACARLRVPNRVEAFAQGSLPKHRKLHTILSLTCPDEVKLARKGERHS
jgi:hypothetical protein